MSTQKDLARIVADRCDVPQQYAERFIADMFGLLKTELTRGDQIKLKGLGTFRVQSVQEKASVDVNTGEKIIIDSHDRIAFTPDNSMKDSVNKPFAHFETVVLNDGVDFGDMDGGESSGLDEPAAVEPAAVEPAAVEPAAVETVETAGNIAPRSSAVPETDGNAGLIRQRNILLAILVAILILAAGYLIGRATSM